MDSSVIVQIPKELANDLLAWASLTEKVFSQIHQIQVSDQAIPVGEEWFWTPEWQAGEQEVDKALANGEYQQFDRIEAAISELTHRAFQEPE